MGRLRLGLKAVILNFYHQKLKIKKKSHCEREHRLRLGLGRLRLGLGLKAVILKFYRQKLNI